MLVQVSPELQQSVNYLLYPGYEQGLSTNERLFCVLANVAHVLNTNGSSSTKDVIDVLVEKRIFNDCSMGQASVEAQSLIFTILGWLTMLYQPHVPFDTTQLLIDSQNFKKFVTDFQPLGQALRPITEMLSVFGPVLPTPSIHEAGQSLQASQLDASILRKIGGLTIRWVDSFSAHFHLDLTTKQLYMFRLPSYCRLVASDASFHAS